MKVMNSAINKASLSSDPIKELQELAVNALSRAEVVPYAEGEQSLPVLPHGMAGNGVPNIVEFERSPTRRKLVGIDSSCIVVGQMESSLLLAAKACVAVVDGGIRYHVLGPILLPTTPEIVREMTRWVETDALSAKLAQIDVTYAKSLTMSFIEGTLLAQVAPSSPGAIVLIDGPTPLTRKFKHSHFSAAIRTVIDSGGDVAAISKTTRLFVMFSHMVSMLATARPPAAVRLPLRKRFVMFAVLSRGGVTLRVDFPPFYTQDEAIAVLSEIASSDVGSRGYPDALRLAHIYSKLTYSERVAALSRLRKLGVKIVPSQKRRDAIFGPFNRQWVTRRAAFR